MSKVRVHELAKELNKSSKDVIYALKSHGVVVESHMSTVSTENADKIRRFFAPKPEVKPQPVKAAEVKTENKQEAKPMKNEESQMNKPQAGNALRKNVPGGQNRMQGERQNNQRSDRQGSFRNDRNGDRPGSFRNDRNNDRNSDRNNDRSSDRNNDRTGGFRNDRNANRPQGDRQRSGDRVGDRQGSFRNDRNGDRPNNFRNDRNGDRPNNFRNDRNNDRPRNDRNQGSFAGRSDDRSFNGQNRQDNRRSQNQGFDKNNERGQRDNNRNAGRDKNYGSRDREAKFNLDSAISKEVVVTKDTTRESRRNFKDKGNKEKDLRERENEKKLNKTSDKNTLTKKSALSKPVQKPKPVVEKVKEIVLPDMITLKELGEKMKVNPSEIIKKLFLSGKMVTLNTEISFEEAEEIAMDYDILCEHEVVVDVIEELLKENEESEDDMEQRPPVVCVMGHVDHGKTSILDAIRQTRVTAGEAGGITQHIGAYVVDVKGQKITFLDTPGHEAFTAMRLRGAQSTDIAILVVAADDGVMPQTVEAINHAKAAGIEIIVAINKIDKPSANIDRVKQELTEYGLIAEDWGGQTIMVPVSAHTKEGLDDLLDMILLVAEVRELKANPNRKARGLVLEAQLDKGRGPVATVLVQKGTLNVGDTIAVGTAYGRVRAMIDDTGRRVKKATPSTPVEILGLNDVPQAGEVFVATENEKEARAFAETFIANNREKMLADTKAKLSLDGLFDQIQAGQIKELNIVVKADVQGSVEAVKQSLVKLSNDEVAVKVIHGGVGAINESDVTLASASNAIIIGFNVRPDNTAKAVAETEKVDIRLYRVIYNAIEDVEAAMKGMLDPTFEEKIIGHAEVRQTYKVSGVGTIIGGYVTDGKVNRGCKARLLRDNIVIYEGELASLKRFKDDVKEVNSGYEFGMSFDKFNDIKEGDKVEFFVMEEVAR
ncbi:MAG: translation initiation factor IF-2 [Clostridiales bacterium]|nr:translation initiation factor IF-2 [Clostridiales bacterium]MDY3745832.1 translation initiation factor IF-2 [Lachnospiraceae bacterium]